jgi:hypothetical protein
MQTVAEHVAALVLRGARVRRALQVELAVACLGVGAAFVRSLLPIEKDALSAVIVTMVPVLALAAFFFGLGLHSYAELRRIRRRADELLPYLERRTSVLEKE